MKLIIISTALSMLMAAAAFAGDPGYTGTGGGPKSGNVAVGSENRKEGSVNAKVMGGEGNKSSTDKSTQGSSKERNGGTNGRLGGTGT